MDQRVALAIDVGGTKVAGGLIAADGAVVYSLARDVPRSGALADPDLVETVAIARHLSQEVDRRDCTGVALGVGVPEYVDGGGLLTSREVIGWSAQPQSELARYAPRNHCTIESDVRCGAIAEAVVGIGRGSASFLYVSLGTGLSSTMVINGEPWAGARGEAIGLGEVRGRAADPEPETLEARASGQALARRFAAVRGIEASTARVVIERANVGDSDAMGIVVAAADALAVGIADIVAVLDPAIVVLGGGLGVADGAFHDRLFATYARAAGRRPATPPIVRAKTGAVAGLIGAGLVAWRTAQRDQA